MKTTDATEKVADDLPIQVPPPISDPLYAQVIGHLEADLSAARERASKAERKVKELGDIADQVELLRDSIASMRNELEIMKNQVVQGNQYTEAMYKIINKIFRS